MLNSQQNSHHPVEPPAIMKSLMGTPIKHDDDSVGTGLIADKELELKIGSLNKINLLTSSGKKSMRIDPVRVGDQAKRMLFGNDEASQRKEQRDTRTLSGETVTRKSHYVKSGQKLFQMGKIVSEISKQQLPEINVRRDLNFGQQSQQKTKDHDSILVKRSPSPRNETFNALSVKKRELSLNETREAEQSGIKRASLTVTDACRSGKKAFTRNPLIKPDSNLITRLLAEEQDERYRYLMRNGTLHYVEQDSWTLFVELKQIPGVMIIYRRPHERHKNVEKIQLDDRQLLRVPLLEGEEKLKFLNLSNNGITKIENIVSLPNLAFLDLTGNKIKEIVAQPTIKSLKVLILGKNEIEEIKNLDCMPSLEILDLHENQIKRMDSIKALQNLRVVNLSNNLIERLEISGPLPNLVELNLRRNAITEIRDLKELPNLHKLYLSGNQISNLDQVTSLPAVTDITLEGNPIDKPGTASQLKERFPSLLYYNLIKIMPASETLKIVPANDTKGRLENLAEKINKSKDVVKVQSSTPKPEPVDSGKENKEVKAVKTDGKLAGTLSNVQLQPKPREAPIKIELPVFKPKNECNVIKIIQKEWEREVERLNAKKAQKLKNQLSSNERSLVQSGHAEIEANKILYIYGNALEVLQRTEFYESVEEMHLIYVRFDLIVYHENLDKLKKFMKLKKLVLSNNYLNSYILLSKIECLTSVQSVQMYDNEIMQCITLPSFITYRFQHVQEYNGKRITDNDKKAAKQQFQLFDKILSIQNVFTKKPTAYLQAANDATKRQELRQRTKKHGEMAGGIGKTWINECVQKDDEMQAFDSKIQEAVWQIVYQTTKQLTGSKQLEDDVKRALMPAQQQQ